LSTPKWGRWKIFEVIGFPTLDGGRWKSLRSFLITALGYGVCFGVMALLIAFGSGKSGNAERPSCTAGLIERYDDPGC
jgi:hypothetical protein